MKKGDIVKMNNTSMASWAAANMAAWSWLEDAPPGSIPETLTIKKVYPKMYCGGIDDGLEFNEIPGHWVERGFTVVQSAGKKVKEGSCELN